MTGAVILVSQSNRRPGNLAEPLARNTMTNYYYHLITEGEDTNLQLYSFRQAKRYWNELRNEYAEFGENTEHLKERCVFVLATLGLSISQLLGQNNPTVQKDVPYPIDVFFEFVDAHGLDPSLKDDFKRFNYFYNGCRHFGRTISGKGYQRINQLTFQVAKECYEFGLRVWTIIIRVYDQDEESDLEEFVDKELDDA